jgi:hypothetical protein
LVATEVPRGSGAVLQEYEATTAVPAATGWCLWLLWALVVLAAVGLAGPTDGRRIYPLLVVFGLAFVGTEVVRRQTLREFPALERPG